MAKIVKRKRKIRLEAFATLFLFVSIFLYLGCATGLKSYNVLLSDQAETMAAQRDEKKVQVSTLETEVKKLTDSDRITAIAEDAGIKANQKNVKIMSEEK